MDTKKNGRMAVRTQQSNALEYADVVKFQSLKREVTYHFQSFASLMNRVTSRIDLMKNPRMIIRISQLDNQISFLKN